MANRLQDYSRKASTLFEGACGLESIKIALDSRLQREAAIYGLKDPGYLALSALLDRISNALAFVSEAGATADLFVKEIKAESGLERLLKGGKGLLGYEEEPKPGKLLLDELGMFETDLARIYRIACETPFVVAGHDYATAVRDGKVAGYAGVPGPIRQVMQFLTNYEMFKRDSTYRQPENLQAAFA